MHPHQPPPYPQQPPPVIYVQQPASRATAVGVWVLVLWILGPALLFLMCCAGVLIVGAADRGVDSIPRRPSPSSGP